MYQKDNEAKAFGIVYRFAIHEHGRLFNRNGIRKEMKKKYNNSNTIKRKTQLLDALEKSLGVVTSACKATKIDRTTFYRWMIDDPEFKSAVNELADVALDFGETQLFKQIQNGVPSSTIFFLKTKGKKRGYIERTETLIADFKEQPLFEVDDNDPDPDESKK